MPMQTLTETCPVPLGEKETIARQLKLKLAHQLQAAYPPAFFTLFHRFADVEGSDAAAPILETMRKKAVCRFSKDLLTAVEALALFAYRRKALSHAAFQAFNAWAEREKENFAEDTIAKDILHKDWYTLSYIDQTGAVKRLTNARRAWIFRKQQQLEREGRVVAPVYGKTYWYNNQVSVDEVRAQHLAACAAVMDAAYMQAVSAIASLPSVIDHDAFLDALRLCEADYGDEAAAALRYYGHIWRVL